MRSRTRINVRAAVEAVKHGLDEWAAPTQVGRAYQRFTSGVYGKRKPIKPSLPDAWNIAYDKLLKDLDRITKKPPVRDAILSAKISDQLKFGELLDRWYGPADEVLLKPDHRYSIEWTYRDSTEIAGSDVASKATGHIQVVNVLSPLPPIANRLGSFTGGTANAGVGFLFRPKYAMAKLTMTPNVPYNYHYIIDHPTNATLSIAKTRGSLRLLCYRVNLFHNTAVLHAEWDKKLWEVENQPIASRHEGQYSGVFNGSPVQLDFTASGDFAYALLCVATVYVNRGFYGSTEGVPPEPTLCTGNLDCNVSSMWLEQEQLA